MDQQGKIEGERIRAETVLGDKAVGVTRDGQTLGVRVTATAVEVAGKAYPLADLESLELNLVRPGRLMALISALACAAVPGGLCAWLSTRPVALTVAALTTAIAYLAVRFLQPETFRLEARSKGAKARHVLAQDRDVAQLQAVRERVRTAQDERRAA